ncbi:MULTISPECIES: hypothetical protein [Ramlibacter]|uniref:Uncharacterized protein n=1 Tax=Ramlibacter aquaticus TaxID=2780094 RepID=A0ABR9SAI1_9BURK|nr:MULTISPECIES: hypothetical protein [Ramlibacter]MBE7939351.1 hypothetical protein [Ramlibacter aquaticus]
MFDRIKKAFGRSNDLAGGKPSAAAPSALGPVSQWAASQGWDLRADAGQGMTLEGQVQGRPWRLQIGPSTRGYIRNHDELRARAELGLAPGVAVLVINRALKDQLERQAYRMYTDSLQTSLDSSMPEEMRWLSIYDEVGWDTLPIEFWKRFSVLSDRRETAQALLDASLADSLMHWPQPGPSPEDPMLLLVMNGKAYLRMALNPARLPTLQHASAVFSAACERALAAFPG